MEELRQFIDEELEKMDCVQQRQEATSRVGDLGNTEGI